VFFVTHAVVLHSKESSDPIIIGDFGGGSGMGIRLAISASFRVRSSLALVRSRVMSSPAPGVM